MLMEWFKALLARLVGKGLGIFVAWLASLGVIIPDDLAAQLTGGLAVLLAIILAAIGDWIVSKIPWFDPAPQTTV